MTIVSVADVSQCLANWRNTIASNYSNISTFNSLPPMKRYELVMIWPDGEEMTLTEPTTRRRKLAQARDMINAKYTDGTRTEIRDAE